MLAAAQSGPIARKAEPLVVTLDGLLGTSESEILPASRGDSSVADLRN